MTKLIPVFLFAWGLAVGNAVADESAPEAAKAEKAEKAGEKALKLFNGKDLSSWEKTNFGGEGDVYVEDGLLVLEMGDPLTGINWKSEKELPVTNYEVSLEAKKMLGDDFFCALTFPVKDSHATFVCGGWGGAVVGISSIDFQDASENDTTDFMSFEDNRWYKIRVRVTDKEILAWIDDKEMAKVNLEESKVMLRSGAIELCVPLGIANFQTRTALRNMTLREVPQGGD
jgi:hypothetical protein